MEDDEKRAGNSSAVQCGVSVLGWVGFVFSNVNFYTLTPLSIFSFFLSLLSLLLFCVCVCVNLPICFLCALVKSTHRVGRAERYSFS